jgi:hypothetical protein
MVAIGQPPFPEGRAQPQIFIGAFEKIGSEMQSGHDGLERARPLIVLVE